MKSKELVHAPTKCGGHFITQFTQDNLPFLVCDKCSHLIDDWIKWETTYSKLYLDESKWDEKKHAIVCLLGHFCALYQDHYQMKYALTLDPKGLFNGTEATILRRIIKMLDNDIKLTREYISWIFITKVKQRKKKITSLSFMCVADFVQEFKFAKKKSLIITRDTLLPQKMLDWVAHCIPKLLDHVSLKDFNDLNIFLVHYNNGHLSSVAEANAFFSKLKEANYIDGEGKLINWRANA